MRTVAAIPSLGLLTGCLLGAWWADAPLAGITFVLAFALVAAGIAVSRHAVWPIAVSVAIGFAAGGVLLARSAWHERERPSIRVLFESIARAERAAGERQKQTLPLDDSASVVVIGRLRRDAAVSPNGIVSLDLAARWIGSARSPGVRRDAATNPVDGGLRLSVAGSFAAERAGDWRAGRVVRAFAQIRRPSRYLDPHVPDMERSLQRRGVALVGSVKSAALVEVLAMGSPLQELAGDVRAWSRAALDASVGRWSAQSAAIVAAIVLGDRTGLDARVEERLQAAGTYHVIAISGGNIAILTGLTLAVFRLLGLLGRGAMLCAIVGLAAYGYLVGGGASVERATWMAVVYLAGRALDVRGSPLNVLAAVAGVLAVANPLAVEEPAFLLTFGATLAIVVSGALLPRRRWPVGVTPILAMFTASVAAEIVLLPIATTFFSRVTVAGLVLNFAAIPLMAVAQLAGLAVLPLALVSMSAAAAAGSVAHLGADGLVRSANLMEWLPFLTWRVAPPSLWVSALYVAAVGAAWWLWLPIRGRGWCRVLAGRVALGIAVLAAVWILFEPWRLLATRGDKSLHVSFIDVGQGDAAFVRFPRGATWLVDTGGLVNGSGFDIGDRVVAPTLRAAGVKRLDTLVLTHGDADHAGGAASLIREFRPRDIWEGIPVPPSPLLQQLRGDARRARARWTTVQAHDTTEVDEVSVFVRHPGLPDWERQDVRNDDSIVLELVWRSVSIVLTGDIGHESERAMLAGFAPAALRVVKAPHHGSLTSSSDAFVEALAPDLAIASVGRGNRFGHPAQAVLERYEKAGAAVFRTDRDGTVALETDGKMLQVTTHSGRRRVLHSQAVRRDASAMATTRHD